MQQETRFEMYFAEFLRFHEFHQCTADSTDNPAMPEFWGWHRHKPSFIKLVLDSFVRQALEFLNTHEGLRGHNSYDRRSYLLFVFNTIGVPAKPNRLRNWFMM